MSTVRLLLVTAVAVGLSALGAALAGCAGSQLNTEQAALDQPPPATAAAAIADMKSVIELHSLKQKFKSADESELHWLEQTHTPQLGWAERSMSFATVVNIVAGGSQSHGWQVVVDCVNMGGQQGLEAQQHTFGLDSPEAAGKLIAALKMLMGVEN